MSRIKTVERVFIALLFSSSLFVAAESSGAEQAHRASLSVKAETARTRDKTKTVDEKANGTITTVADIETETCTLEVEVANAADQNDTYQLEWYFISKKTSAKGDDGLAIIDFGKAPITLDAGASAVKKAVSKPFIFTVKNVENVSKASSSGTGMSRQTRSGDEYSGYIVLIRADGEVLQKDSNSTRFLKDEWLAQCEKLSKITPATKKKKN